MLRDGVDLLRPGGEQLSDVLCQQCLDLLLVAAHRCPALVTGRQFGGGVEQAAAAEAALVREPGVVGVGVEDRQYSVAAVPGVLHPAPVQVQPLLVPRVQVGEHQVRLGREVVVQAHLRDARFGGDRVDAGGRHTVRVETASGRVQQLLACGALPLPRLWCCWGGPGHLTP